MIDQEIKKVLADVKIPEPDELAKEAAISAALEEFAKQKTLAEKKIKGNEKSDRLISTILSKLIFIGESTMKRRYIWPSALTACLIVVVFGVSQLMEESQQIVQTDQPGTFVMPGPARRAEKQTEIANTDVSKSDVGSPAKQQPVKDSKVKNVRPVETTIVMLAEEEIVRGKIVAPEPLQSPKPMSANKVEAKRSRLQGAKGIAQLSNGGLKKNERSSNLGYKTFMNQSPLQESDDYMLPPPQVQGRDKFKDVEINPVKQVAKEPVSTFSVDVDTASYAFVRKMLNRGTLPQKNAVRVEELINYFDYDYALPKDKNKPFLPTVAVYPTPWNPDTKLLHIGIRGYDIEATKKPDTNLVFLIDVSGSMNLPDKLPLLKNAFRMLVENLQETDTVSMVVYAGAAGTVLEPTKVKQKGKILSALEKLSAGGSTAGGEGIRQAYALAEAHYIKGGVNRVILATDGDFNVGIRNQAELKGFVERKRKTGIFLSVIGFGQGNYNDALMQTLAQNGNGNASYIDNLNEARKVLVEEANATLFTIAKDVKIQIEFNPAKVAEYRLIGYETRMLKREDFNNDQVDAGDVGSGHRVTAIYEITEPKSKAKLVDDLRYGSEQSTGQKAVTNSQEYAFLKIRYKAPDSDQSSLMSVSIGAKEEYKSLQKVPGEIRFAASVAAYGQLLRQDPYTKGFTLDHVIKLALSARGNDPYGLRSEFVNLVRLAKTARGL